MSAVLPPTPKPQLADTGRARRMQMARGACWVIVVALGSVSAIALIDATLALPGWARGVCLAAWLTALGVLVWKLVVQPTTDPHARTSRQELSGNLRAATAATAALASCVLAAVFVPGALDQFRRVALPWHGNTAATFRVVVTSGEPVVARGESVTLTGYIEANGTRNGTALFAIRAPNAPETRITAILNGDAAFRATLPATNDFEYRAEYEGGVSDWYTVTALDRIELTEGSAINLSPPKYASAEVQTLRADAGVLNGLRHGTAELRLHFNRPVADAYLEFRAGTGPPELTHLSLSADAFSGSVTFRLRHDGTLRIVAIAERNGKRLRTTLAELAVKARPDKPPRFLQLTGLPARPATARPGEKLQLKLVVSDDVAMGVAALEWLPPGHMRPRSIPISLTPMDVKQASGSLSFDLFGKAELGETLRLRVRISDTRKLDEAALSPQETLYPESGWAEVRIEVDALPLEIQCITTRRDAVRERLRAAGDSLRDALQEVELAAEDAAGKPDLRVDLVIRLNNAREAIRSTAETLQKVAREASLSPELSRVDAEVRDSATRLEQTAEVVRLAATANVAARADWFTDAITQLNQTTDRIENASAETDRICRIRIDALLLGSLAADQSALADRIKDASSDELQGMQQLLIERYQHLLSESLPLRELSESAQRASLDQLTEQIADIAGSVRSLNDAIKVTIAHTRDSMMGTIASELNSITKNAAELVNDVAIASRLANTAAPKVAEFENVKGLLAKEKAIEALTELARLALNLDTVAAQFEKQAAARSDAKIALQQLAAWQDNLIARFRLATAGKPTNFATLPVAEQIPLITEQAAIRATVTALRVPASGGAIRDDALTHLTVAGNLMSGSGAGVENAMRAATEQLNRLAEKLPTGPERLAKARPEFDKLMREQEAIQSAIEQLIRKTEPLALPKKLTLLADRQKNQIASFAELDLPGLDARRTSCLAALTAAVTDLREGLSHDVPASQAWVKREVDRLRAVLIDHSIPTDDKANEIVQRLKDIATRVESINAMFPDYLANGPPFLAKFVEGVKAVRIESLLRPHIAAMQEVTRILSQLPPCPEAGTLLHSTREAVRIADIALRNEPRPQALLQKVRMATEESRLLADRLTGHESDYDRLLRLAANRRNAAILAKAIPAGASINSETSRELAREIDELMTTRVGVVAQSHKKRLLDQYSRLRDHAAPDRQAGAHEAIAESLQIVAALTADIAELTNTFDRGIMPPGQSAPGDAYLPSQWHANNLRKLAERCQSIRERIAQFPAELQQQLQPLSSDPLAEIVQRQSALAHDAEQLTESLFRQPVHFPFDPRQAAREARIAVYHFRNGELRSGIEHARRSADLFRQLAKSERATAALALADRQDAIVTEALKWKDRPGAASARQHARANELTQLANNLSRQLEQKALDSESNEQTATTLREVGSAIRTAGVTLANSAEQMNRRNAEKAEALRFEVETQLRVAAARLASAGPIMTTLPAFDPQAARAGIAVARAEAAMLVVKRMLGASITAGVIPKAIEVAANDLRQAAELLGDQLKEPVKP